MKKYRQADRVVALSFITYAASANAVPIALVRIADELDFQLTAGGLLESVRTLLLFLCLFSSVYLARRFGKPLVIAAGALLLCCSFVLFFMVSSYALLLLAMMICGLGGGLLEALINPLVEALHPEDDGSIINRMNGYFSLGVVITMLGGGVALSLGLSWRVLFIILLLPATLLSIGHLNIHRQQLVAKDKVDHHTNLALLRRLTFWYFGLAMVFGGAVEGGFTYWSASLIQLRFQTLPLAGGIGTAIFALGMVLGRMRGDLLITRLGLVGQIVYSALIGMVVSLAFFWLPNFWSMLPMLFLAGLCTACHWPSIQSLAVKQLKANNTFVFISLSCCGIIGFGSSTLLLGFIGDLSNLAVGFLLLPVFFAGIILTIRASQHSLSNKSGAGA